MAILGYNTKGSANTPFGALVGNASKFTLASAGTLNELHGWFGGSGTNVTLFIYSDSAAYPAARLAYTSPLALTGVDVELSQSGFSVALAAGDYWIGFVPQGAGTSAKIYREATGSTSEGVGFVSYNPPDNPFPTGASAGTRKYSVWAVVGAAAAPSTFVPQITIL